MKKRRPERQRPVGGVCPAQAYPAASQNRRFRSFTSSRADRPHSQVPVVPPHPSRLPNPTRCAPRHPSAHHCSPPTTVARAPEGFRVRSQYCSFKSCHSVRPELVEGSYQCEQASTSSARTVKRTVLGQVSHFPYSNTEPKRVV